MRHLMKLLFDNGVGDSRERHVSMESVKKEKNNKMQQSDVYYQLLS